MTLTQHSPAALMRLDQQRLGLDKLTPALVKPSQFVGGPQDLEVLLSEDALPNLDDSDE
jgi:hypothetical protein